MVKQNLGNLDRIFRFALAAWWLGPLAPQYGAPVGWLIAIIGWIALLESFTGWCGIHNLLGIHNKD